MDKVLIVDYDLESLTILKEGLQKYESQFKVLTALNYDSISSLDQSLRKNISSCA